jgi:hypothetical protein
MLNKKKKRPLRRKINTIVDGVEIADETQNYYAELTKDRIVKELKDNVDIYELDFKAITAIFEAVVEYSAGQYIDALTKHRKERRKLDNNLKLYIENVEEYQEKLHDILLENEEELLELIDIEEKEWRDALNKCNNGEYKNKLQQLKFLLEKKMKLYLQPQRKLGEEEFAAIVEDQIGYLRQDTEHLKTFIKDNHLSKEVTTKLVNSKLLDYVYLNYHCEEEDLMPFYLQDHVEGEYTLKILKKYHLEFMKFLIY